MSYLNSLLHRKGRELIVGYVSSVENTSARRGQPQHSVYYVFAADRYIGRAIDPTPVETI